MQREMKQKQSSKACKALTEVERLRKELHESNAKRCVHSHTLCCSASHMVHDVQGRIFSNVIRHHKGASRTNVAFDSCASNQPTHRIFFRCWFAQGLNIAAPKPSISTAKPVKTRTVQVHTPSPRGVKSRQSLLRWNKVSFVTLFLILTSMLPAQPLFWHIRASLIPTK